MSIPTDSAVRSAARDSGVASDNPKSTAASRSVPNAASPSPGSIAKLNLASSIQALKELSAKGNSAAAPITPAGLTGEPLATAYEKRIQTLQDTLKERDQVVQMLTQRLEQAADQLDRMHRSGAGRGGSVVAAGLPPELVENQQALLEQLTRVLGDWESAQAAQTLTRIETQITELRELVASGTIAPANVSALVSPSSAASKESPTAPQKASAGASVFSDIPAAEPAKTGWEAIKAAMMAGENYVPPPTNSPTPAAETAKPQESPSAAEESAPTAQRLAPPPLPEPPPAVDFDIADQAMLVEAIRSRDEFISLLLRRLSSPDANTEFPDWEKLNFVPEELHRELLGLRERLQEKLRVAEVDLSLQRAKLAREEAKLTMKAEHVARQMRQLGLAPDESGSQVGGARALNEGSNATQGRRWLQFLQRSNGNGSGTDGK